MTSQAFWAEHQVGGPYKNVKESSLALRDRALRYDGLYKLMPVYLPGRRVLDYGCGPGHDTILFSQNGADVTYWDFSPQAMETTRNRLRLHGLPAQPLTTPRLFDHIHCAGVLHHTDDPIRILAELARMLAPEKHIYLMVYDGELSDHTQSEVPITHWWTFEEIGDMAAQAAGMSASYLGSYECSAPWRPNCWAACYRLQIPQWSR